MGNIQLFQYNDTPMEFEVINGQVFANATIMCQHFGKDVNQWKRLSSTQRYADALCTKHITDLFEVRQGGVEQGTWIHEKLILKLAQWLDVDFEIWCDEKLAELLRTGSVSLRQPPALQLPQTYIEALEELVKAEKEKLLLQQTNSNLKTALDTLNDWSSILRVAKHNNVNENIFDWRKLKNASRKLGYEVKKAPSPRYNYQNLYHLDAFRLVYPQFNYDLPDFVD
jgi:hypothetical protein